MLKVKNVKLAASKFAGRSGLVLKKYSPEILIGVGIAGIITSTVLACRATLKAQNILNERNEKKHCIDTVSADSDYSEEDHRKDLAIVNLQTGVSFVKLYGPSITLMGASIACILGAHHIMSRRNVALMALYKTSEQALSNFYKRVADEYGEDKARQLKYGIKEETVKTVEEGEDGKKKTVKSTVETVDPNGYSQYARIFDESNDNWTKNPEYNLMFLKAQQNSANDLLQARGHIFLNEVYDMLSIPRTQAGAIVGWVKGQGDGFVDFNLYNLNSARARDFVNGYERNIVIDPNVDGVIYDLI